MAKVNSDSVTRTIGEQLKAMRDRRGWSLSDLEAKCGVTKSYIAKIERGEVPRPGIKVLSKIAGGLDVPLSVLVPDGAYDESFKSGASTLDSKDILLRKYPDLNVALTRLGTKLAPKDLSFLVDAIDLIAAKRSSGAA